MPLTRPKVRPAQGFFDGGQVEKNRTWFAKGFRGAADWEQYPSPETASGTRRSPLADGIGIGERGSGGAIWAPHAALLVVQVCFASFPHAAKIALSGLPPMAMATYRVCGGALLLLFFARLLYPARWKLPTGDLASVFLLSLLGVSLNQILFIEGVRRTTTVNAGLLIGLIPVLTYGMAVLLSKERARPRKTLGVALALVGTGQLFFGRGASLTADHLVGNALIVANCTVYSLYLVLARPLLQRVPAFVVVAWMFVLAVPVVPWFNLGRPFLPSPDGGTPVLLAVGWVVLFPTVIAYALNAWALARVETSVTAIYVYLQPILIGVAGYFLRDEPIGPREWTALGLVLAGIHLVTRRRTPRQAPTVATYRSSS